MLEMGKYGSFDKNDADDNLIFIIPIKTPTNDQELEDFLNAGDDDSLTLASASRSRRNWQKEVDESTIIIHAVGDTPEETFNNIEEDLGHDPDESLCRAAACAPYWRKIGAEVLIYSCSFAGLGVATGMLIRFANTPALASMIVGNGLAVIANENARVFFTSLLKPHGEKMPGEKAGQYELIKKYAVHPMSTFLTSSVGGTAVSFVGSTNLGTRQSIVSVTAQLGGLTTYLAGTSLLKCYGGSIVLKPDHPGVRSEFKKIYSTAANKDDENRPYVAGAIRNTFTRILGMTAATLTSWYSGAYMLENYCGPEGRQILLNMTGDITGEDIHQYCIGGNATFLFRDWGVTGVNMVGFVVLQPALNYAFNSVFDYFFTPPEDNEETHELLARPEGGSGQS